MDLARSPVPLNMATSGHMCWRRLSGASEQQLHGVFVVKLWRAQGTSWYCWVRFNVMLTSSHQIEVWAPSVFECWFQAFSKGWSSSLFSHIPENDGFISLFSLFQKTIFPINFQIKVKLWVLRITDYKKGQPARTLSPACPESYAKYFLSLKSSKNGKDSF